MPIEENNGDEKSTSGAVNKATVRIFQVLAAFVGQTAPCGVTELSQALGMTKSMVHRALITLEDQGYISKDKLSNLYQLGNQLVELSSPGESEPTVHDLVMPFLREIVEIARETVVIVVPVGRRAVIVGGMEGGQAISHRVLIGASTPLHVEPAGRCILANLRDEDIDRYLLHPLERYTESTIFDPIRLRLELRAIRDNKYCLGAGDLSAGTTAVGFPVMDADSTPHGAISIIGPTWRFKDHVDKVRRELEEIVLEMHRNSQLHRTLAVIGEE